MRKLFFFLCFLFLSCVIFIVTSYAATDLLVDDRGDGLTYTASSRIYDSSALNGSLSQVSSSNSVTFSFYGPDLQIYAASYTNSGKIAIYIDNVYKGSFSPGQSLDYDVKELVSFSDLGYDDHLLVAVTVSEYVEDLSSGRDTLGRAYYDYFAINSDYQISDNYMPVLIFIACFLAIDVLFGCLNFWRYLKNDN